MLTSRIAVAGGGGGGGWLLWDKLCWGWGLWSCHNIMGRSGGEQSGRMGIPIAVYGVKERSRWGSLGAIIFLL